VLRFNKFKQLSAVEIERALSLMITLINWASPYSGRSSQAGRPIVNLVGRRRSSLSRSERLPLSNKVDVSAINMPKRNFRSPQFGTKFQRKVPLFLAIPPYRNFFTTVQDRWKEALVPEISSIRSSVSIELRLATDGHRQTDRHRAIA